MVCIALKYIIECYFLLLNVTIATRLREMFNIYVRVKDMPPRHPIHDSP